MRPKDFAKRTPGRLAPLFRARLEAIFALRARRVFAAPDDMCAGAIQESRFGLRARGFGERWQTIQRLFEFECKRRSLSAVRDAPPPPPPPPRQALLLS